MHTPHSDRDRDRGHTATEFGTRPRPLVDLVAFVDIDVVVLSRGDCEEIKQRTVILFLLGNACPLLDPIHPWAACS